MNNNNFSLDDNQGEQNQPTGEDGQQQQRRNSRNTTRRLKNPGQYPKPRY